MKLVSTVIIIGVFILGIGIGAGITFRYSTPNSQPQVFSYVDFCEEINQVSKDSTIPTKLEVWQENGTLHTKFEGKRLAVIEDSIKSSYSTTKALFTMNPNVDNTPPSHARVMLYLYNYCMERESNMISVCDKRKDVGGVFISYNAYKYYELQSIKWSHILMQESANPGPEKEEQGIVDADLVINK